MNTRKSECSSITDKELRQAILSRWPMKKGVAEIFYTFSTQLFWWDFYNYNNAFRGLTPYPSISENENYIRDALNNWEAISHGTLKFVEKNYIDDIGPFSASGLFFYFVDRAKLTQVKNASGFASIIHTHENFILRSSIFFPTDLLITNNFFQESWPPLLVRHEIGHALGFAHLHEYPDILTKLKEIDEVHLCSVMPYPSEISIFARSPSKLGELDERLVELGYKNPMEGSFNEIQAIRFVYEPFLVSLVVSTIHQSFHSGFAHLTSNQKIFIFFKENAQDVADAIIYGTFFLLRCPAPIVVCSIICQKTLAIISKELPLKTQFFLRNVINLFLLNSMLVYLKDQSLLLYLIRFSATASGQCIGFYSGNRVGSSIAKLVNWVAQKYNDFSEKEWKPANNTISVFENDQSNISNSTTITLPLSTQKNTLFYQPKPRISFCLKITQYFCRKK